MNTLKIIAARYFVGAYLAIILFIFFPLGIVLFANILSVISQCPSGVQISNAVCTNGDIIYGLGQAGWLLAFTVPVGLLLLCGVLVINIIAFLLIKNKAAVAGYVLQKITKKFTK